MKRKLIYFFASILIVGCLFFQGCVNLPVEDKEYILPNLTNMSREEISTVLDEMGIRYSFKFSQIVCYNDSQRDKFVNYGSGLEAGMTIKAEQFIYVYTTVLPLCINNLDKVSLTTEYKGKSFIDDGIGEVTLTKAIDGDTADFIDPYSKTLKGSFRVRFLGIDTPESTFRTDPWGKEASKFTKNKLEQADTIVLEAEGARTETYGRYLAFVWIDGKLFNLELVQEAYCTSTLPGSSKFFQIMMDTALEARKTGRRFYGEKDPNYDYTKK